jgi:hypothetical protein
MLAYGARDTDELHFYFASLDCEWTAHPMNPVVSDVRCARPAGRTFEHDGVLVSPGQDSSGNVRVRGGLEPDRGPDARRLLGARDCADRYGLAQGQSRYTHVQLELALRGRRRPAPRRLAVETTSLEPRAPVCQRCSARSVQLPWHRPKSSVTLPRLRVAHAHPRVWFRPHSRNELTEPTRSRPAAVDRVAGSWFSGTPPNGG